jgi:hypothetical protein
MPYELCRHVKVNGLRCQSPALTGESWCYFHHRLITRHRYLNQARVDRTTLALRLPALEDRESIQVALSLITDAILTGILPEKRAAILLRAISIASRNASAIVTQPADPDKIVRSTMPTLDGFNLDERRMDDLSQPPARPQHRGSHRPEPDILDNTPAPLSPFREVSS